MHHFFSLVLALIFSCSLFANKPGIPGAKASRKAVKRDIVRVVPNPVRHNVITLESDEKITDISFVILDAEGIIRMFGDNYRAGSNINVAHLAQGNYTILFSRDLSSSEGHFTVR